MNYQNDDLRIKEINELLPPVALLEKFPATENAANTVAHARKAGYVGELPRQRRRNLPA